MCSKGSRGAVQEGSFRGPRMRLRNMSEEPTYIFKEEPLELVR